MFDPAKLSKLLKRLRKKHKPSLNQLAKLSGLSRRTLSLLLFGIRTW